MLNIYSHLLQLRKKKEVMKMKTKKLLSVLMAIMMLFGCMSISASARDWPAELGQGVAKFRGIGSISSVEIPVAVAYTNIAAEATFTVYYSEEKVENIFDAAINCEEVGVLGVSDAYLKDGVLHLDLKGLGLDAEGYYYITVGGSSLTYDGGFNMTATTEGVLYQFASLGAADKIVLIFDFIAGLLTNLISNGKIY